MNTYLLFTQGEMLEGEEELIKLGYNVIPYLGNNDTSKLRNTYKDIPGLAQKPEYLVDNGNWMHTAHTNPLRANFANMIEAGIDSDDFTVFGESDCFPAVYPPIAAEDVAALCQQAVSRNPEIGIIRPYRNNQGYGKPGIENHQEPFLVPLKKAPVISICTYYCGTHALIIRKQARRIVADAMRDYHLPIDILVSWLSNNDIVPMWHTNINLMNQRPRSSGVRYEAWCRKHSLPLGKYWRLGGERRLS